MLVLAVVALEVPLIISLRERVDAEVRSQSRGQAEIVATSVVEDMDDPRALQAISEQTARNVRGRVVVVGPRGGLRADSAGEDRIGSDYSTRPEIQAALGGAVYQQERASETLDERILATAVPVVRGQTRLGVVRITQSVDAVARATWRATLGLVAIGLLVLLLGLAAGALIAGQVAGPVRRLDAAARRVAEGDLAARARVEGSAEQQRLARTFNDMTARLERLVASQREFVADASHQLRTPLSGLRLRLEEAHAATADADARQEIDAGLAELDRLSAMVSELLVLSHAGEADAPPERVDLGEAARCAAARWDGAVGGRVVVRAEAAGRALVPGSAAPAGEDRARGAPIPGSAPPAGDDRARGASIPGFAPPADLDRALDALIENALHYGGGDVELRVRPGALEVLDRGPGLAPDELDAVFERFHRGAAGRAGPTGTGLGLPIARELARRWGGEVMLANREGGGARATVTIPPFPGA